MNNNVSQNADRAYAVSLKIKMRRHTNGTRWKNQKKTELLERRDSFYFGDTSLITYSLHKTGKLNP